MAVLFSAGQLQQFLKFTGSLLVVRAATLAAAVAATMTTPITLTRVDPLSGATITVDVLCFIQDFKMKDPPPKEEIFLQVPLSTDVLIGDQFTYDLWVWSISDRATAVIEGIAAAIEVRGTRLRYLGGTVLNTLTTTATVTLTAANGAIVARDLLIDLEPAKVTERIAPDGGVIAYKAIAMPPIDLAENARLLVTDCPGNPYLVGARPYLVTDVQQRGQPSPATLFSVSVKKQP